MLCVHLSGGVCWSKTCDKGNGDPSMEGLNVGQGKAFITLRVPFDKNRSLRSGQCDTWDRWFSRTLGTSFWDLKGRARAESAGSAGSPSDSGGVGPGPHVGNSFMRSGRKWPEHGSASLPDPASTEQTAPQPTRGLPCPPVLSLLVMLSFAFNLS